jgi:hypothetical protein
MLQFLHMDGMVRSVPKYRPTRARGPLLGSSSRSFPWVPCNTNRLTQLAGVNPAPPPVEYVPGQGVELLDFEQAAPDPAAQFRLREVLEDELGLEDSPEIAIGAVETVLGAEAYQPFQGIDIASEPA